jgi:hypothetical protein
MKTAPFSKLPTEVLSDNLKEGYTGIHFYPGMPILDRDLNLLNDLSDAKIRSFLINFIGDGVNHEDSFRPKIIVNSQQLQQLQINIRANGKKDHCLVSGYNITYQGKLEGESIEYIEHLKEFKEAYEDQTSLKDQTPLLEELITKWDKWTKDNSGKEIQNGKELQIDIRVWQEEVECAKDIKDSYENDIDLVPTGRQVVNWHIIVSEEGAANLLNIPKKYKKKPGEVYYKLGTLKFTQKSKCLKIESDERRVISPQWNLASAREPYPIKLPSCLIDEKGSNFWIHLAHLINLQESKDTWDLENPLQIVELELKREFLISQTNEELKEDEFSILVIIDNSKEDSLIKEKICELIILINSGQKISEIQHNNIEVEPNGVETITFKAVVLNKLQELKVHFKKFSKTITVESEWNYLEDSKWLSELETALEQQKTYRLLHFNSQGVLVSVTPVFMTKKSLPNLIKA